MITCNEDIVKAKDSLNYNDTTEYIHKNIDSLSTPTDRLQDSLIQSEVYGRSNRDTVTSRDINNYTKYVVHCADVFYPDTAIVGEDYPTHLGCDTIIRIFHDTKFENNADFFGTNFISTAYFYSSIFDTIASFGYAEFPYGAIFTNAKFHTNANFSGCGIWTWVNFDGAHFDSIADFSYSHFSATVSFEYTYLPYFLDLSNVRIANGFIDLSKCYANMRYDGICKINLVGTDVYKIKLHYSDFELYFENYVDDETISTIYENLLETQEKEGYRLSVEKLDREYRAFKYKMNKSYLTNWIVKNWSDYGYNRGLIFRNTFIIFLFFCMINVFTVKGQLSHIYEIPHLNQLLLNNYKRVIYKIINHTIIGIFYTSVVFFGVKIDFNKLNYKENLNLSKIYRLIYFFTFYLSGIICLAHIAGYVLSR